MPTLLPTDPRLQLSHIEFTTFHDLLLTFDSPRKTFGAPFYIRRRREFTARLYKEARTLPGLHALAFMDGPYGGIDKQKYFDSDRIIVVAGGSEAGWDALYR
ncbi:uncharacterized protein A1O9_03745 [Exophiala aquamarina CBS 119918]|uniref:Uncharacterized protein n=1 Tax=Exophiala aquamarina CBS 119918 TaxID=1182545 RepID=A0A072PGM8_9EURO|nr:uncharacterized protein A1O9_03745 [Exophiala aquamarina CBS 119918]KEF58902.1 hypothetical protein A1O9_03745 [Exophiala aquamarina CBS 119918]